MYDLYDRYIIIIKKESLCECREKEYLESGTEEELEHLNHGGRRKENESRPKRQSVITALYLHQSSGGGTQRSLHEVPDYDIASVCELWTQQGM